MYKPAGAGAAGGGAALAIGTGHGGGGSPVSAALAMTGMNLLPWVLIALTCLLAGVIVLRTSMIRRANPQPAGPDEPAGPGEPTQR